MACHLRCSGTRAWSRQGNGAKRPRTCTEIVRKRPSTIRTSRDRLPRGTGPLTSSKSGVFPIRGVLTAGPVRRSGQMAPADWSGSTAGSEPVLCASRLSRPADRTGRPFLIEAGRPRQSAQKTSTPPRGMEDLVCNNPQEEYTIEHPFLRDRLGPTTPEGGGPAV